jgi:hypothetical protein
MFALAGMPNLRGECTLYIADDYAGAIYAQDLAQPGTPPELVSGKTALQAEVAVLLSATESVFVPTPGQDWIHSLYHVDHGTGAKQLLHAFGRFDRILAIDADDDSNGVTVLLERDLSLLLVRSVRPSTTEPWTAAEPLVVRTSASVPPTGDVLRLEENLYAIHFLPETDANNLRLYAVGDDGLTTSTLNASPPHTARRFARSNTGEWLLYLPDVAPAEGIAPLQLFDASNQQVDLTEEPAHPLFQQRLQAVEWRHSLAELTAVTPTARLMRIASDGTIWLLQSNPPQLSIWNDETGEVADLPTIIGPELGLPRKIRHAPADLVLAPDGSSAYISYSRAKRHLWRESDGRQHVAPIARQAGDDGRAPARPRGHGTLQARRRSDGRCVEGKSVDRAGRLCPVTETESGPRGLVALHAPASEREELADFVPTS